MLNYQRTHNCGQLSASDIGKTVRLSGWVNKRRNLGNLIFIDLRDKFGITQITIDPKLNLHLIEIASELRSEWVITVSGKVVERAQGMANHKMLTGAIEIIAEEIDILSQAKTPPFSVCDEFIEVNEELRLKYRYLDIRRGSVIHNLQLRHQAMLSTRNFMSKLGFVEVSTPILAKSTPEGARDYLVPSRVHPGNFYALPQSPQIFKQLLMVSGLDRYFQIAPCFRDEDLRADRQPEFTQIDIEMSFGTPETLHPILEDLISTIFLDCTGIELSTPFPRMSYKDALEKFGTDRPDTRFSMHLVRIDDLARQTSFPAFTSQLPTDGCIKGLCIKAGADSSRKKIEELTLTVTQLGLGGLAWIKKQEGAITSSILKFLDEKSLQALIERFSMEDGDLVLIGAGPEGKVNQAMDHLRRKIAKERGLINPKQYNFLWVVDFPMFKWNEEENRIESEHHPFTSPHLNDLSLLQNEPLKTRALAYDLVLNGYEIGGGSQRIHCPEMQAKVFSLLNLSEEEILTKFGFFVEALQYGTPPHLGFAFGLDRIVMLLCETDNIRDVIAFPKTQKASDLMMQCPSNVSTKQLKELEITTQPKEIHWL